MKNLRATFALLLGCFLIAISSSLPSSAFLGLNKCEKMVKKVENQEKITTALWNNFDRQRKQIDSLESGNASSKLLDQPVADISRQIKLNKTLLGMALDINKSGLKTINLMTAESNCFKADTYAKLINQATTRKSIVRDWESAYRSKSNELYDFKTVFPTKPASFLRNFPVK